MDYNKTMLNKITYFKIYGLTILFISIYIKNPFQYRVRSNIEIFVSNVFQVHSQCHFKILPSFITQSFP